MEEPAAGVRVLVRRRQLQRGQPGKGRQGYPRCRTRQILKDEPFRPSRKRKRRSSHRRSCFRLGRTSELKRKEPPMTQLKHVVEPFGEVNVHPAGGKVRVVATIL